MEFEIPRLEAKNVEIGYGGILLYSLDASPREQIGYSIRKNGESLIGFDDGDWLEGWYVIGRDLSLGDPIFIDLNDPEIPVYTSSHGMGSWTPAFIAPSYPSFLLALGLLECISIGRSTPAKLHANPISKEESEKYLNEIATITGEAENYFWASYVGI